MHRTPQQEEENYITIEEIDDYLPGFDESHPKPKPKSEPFFLRTFASTPGCLRFLLTAFLVGFSTGMCIAMIPKIFSDRFARLNYGYTGEPCYEMTYHNKSEACQSGFDDAQSFHVWSNFGKNILLLFFSPVVGTLSDSTGRRHFFLISVFLIILPQVALVLILLVETMNPVWFYFTFSCTGFTDWLPLTFASLSDVLPGKLRAPGYALVLASYLTALAAGPYFATLFSYELVSIIALVMAMITFIYASVFVQETLSYEISAASEVVRRRNSECGWLLRPFRDLSILARNRLLRVLSVVSLITALSYATDQTFVIYYVENHLDFTDSDTAQYFLVISICSILTNVMLLKQAIKCFGEKRVLVATIAFGIVHNFLYGIATDELLILVAGGLSSLTSLSYPVIASIQSYNCADHEQGQIQGAFFSLNALSRAVSPFLMLRVYNATEHNKGLFGAGTMFFLVSFFNLIAVCFAVVVPASDANSEKKN